MMKNKFLMVLISLVAAITLAACGGGNDEANQNENTNTDTNTEENTEMNHGTEEGSGGTDHSSMNHSSSGEVPEGLQETDNPTYPVDSQAIINADHMEGMNGAEATIAGAYDTTVYTVTYTPTTGGEPVEDHKWVIHEELKNPGDAPLEPGTEVTLNADHMEGMQGATATIDSAEETTVYMVDFTDTRTGEEVTNHKWVTESELSPVQ